MVIDASSLPEAPYLVCGECAVPVTDYDWEAKTLQPCGHTAETVRVCMTWAISGDCRCATAFHDTARVVSSRLSWLADLVTRHIAQARGG